MSLAYYDALDRVYADRYYDYVGPYAPTYYMSPRYYDDLYYTRYGRYAPDYVYPTRSYVGPYARSYYYPEDYYYASDRYYDDYYYRSRYYDSYYSRYPRVVPAPVYRPASTYVPAYVSPVKRSYSVGRTSRDYIPASPYRY